MRKHAEMIKAWADNEELVVFIEIEGEWCECQPDWCDEDAEYFACLPQNAKECEHWLNGGSLQVETPIGMGAKWVDIVDYSDGCRDWRPEHFLMCKHSKHRIKAKKEKRWIACHPSGSTTRAFNTRKAALSYMENSTTWQIVEIEVEV